MNPTENDRRVKLDAPERLRESEGRFRALVDAIPDPVLVMREGRVVFASPAAARWLDVPEPGDLLGETLESFLHPGCARAFAARLGEASATFVDETLVRRDGTPLDVEVTLRAVSFDGSPATQMLVRSIVGRRRAEEALKRSEAYYRAIVEDQEEFILRWLPDGTRTFVNDAYCRYFDANRAELIGNNFLSEIHPEDRPRVLSNMRALTPHAPVVADEQRVIRPDGSVGWQLWTDRGIFDDRGKLVELQSVGRDITEHKVAQEALRESEERYRTLVENAPEAIVVFDVAAGRFVDGNANALRLFGLTREELFRAGPEKLSPSVQPDGRSSGAASREYLGRALAGETPVFEWIYRNADGVEIPLEVRLVSLPSSSRQLVQGSLIDISERRELERQLRQSQKMQAVGRLAGGVAHDFNNLLTAINGNAELALARLGDRDSVRRDIEEIRRAGARAAALTGQLLAFSRKQVTHPRVLNLNHVVENLIRMLRRLIGEDIELVTALDPHTGPIEADPSQIEQILLNLAVNARDAMPDGGKLSISTSNVNGRTIPGCSAAETYVLLEVRDTGVGISPEVLPRIFEPFFTTKERGQGTGLGLSTVYGIVKQSGGHLWVDSTATPGATFKVCLPVSSRPAQENAAAVADSPRGTETLLLVEDEAIVRELAVRSLGRYGYEVLECDGGEQALRVAASHAGSIDLIVTDVVMPRMNGPELVRQLADVCPDIPVLFVSGYLDDAILRSGGLDAGAAFLEKPYSPRQLAAKIREILD